MKIWDVSLRMRRKGFDTDVSVTITVAADDIAIAAKKAIDYKKQSIFSLEEKDWDIEVCKAEMIKVVDVE